MRGACTAMMDDQCCKGEEPAMWRTLQQVDAGRQVGSRHVTPAWIKQHAPAPQRRQRLSHQLRAAQGPHDAKAEIDWRSGGGGDQSVAGASQWPQIRAFAGQSAGGGRRAAGGGRRAAGGGTSLGDMP